MHSFNVLFVAPATQIVEVLQSFPLLFFFLVLALSTDLLVEHSNNLLIFLDRLLFFLLLVHLIDSWIALVSLDVWYGSIKLYQFSQIFLSLPLLLLVFVTDTLIFWLSALVLIFLPIIELEVFISHTLCHTLVLHNFRFHGLDESLESVKLCLGLHLRQATL